MSKTNVNLRERKVTVGDDEVIDPTDMGITTSQPTAVASGNSQLGKKKKKYPCGKCDEEVPSTVKSLQCQSCEHWYHISCIPGMNTEFFENCRMALEVCGYSAFLCQICRKVAAKFKRAMKDLEVELDKLKDRVMVLELEKETLAQKVENMEMRTTKVKEGLEGVEREVVSGMEKAKEEVKKDVNREMKEREERSQNLVLYGLEEPAAESMEERTKADAEKVKEVMTVIGVEAEAEVKFRAGKKGEGESPRPRPLIITVKDDECRMKILRDARNLARSSHLKKVYVATDMTWAQREEARKMEKDLREEAERKTEEARKDGKNGKFVVVGPRGRRRMIWIEGGE